ncbi:hypothetical protein TUN199_01984 [Pyrenophora tritici-repentis]|nr:hypothetical protein Alg130_05009 [Pyrenophora tritici-repentis]KAI0610703.1 hypothetical protein TUN205_05038 [Pyrenophora tritici-repentis]KAI0625984.1 hypothetical protein TUN199_01984 [Pyrenophora tritici-repentis]
MKLILQRRSGTEIELQMPTNGPSPHLSHSSSSSVESPRIVPPDIAAKRIGNPPRRASLPVPRPGAINTLLQPPSTGRTSHSLRQNTTLDTHKPRPKSALATHEVRPTSPKLHYIHGLPNSKAYPYIYKREVTHHLAAVRAGSPSPLADFALAAQTRTSVNMTTDYSETVYYGSRMSSAFSPTPEQHRSRQPRRGNVVVEQTANRDGYVVTEHPHLHQQAGIQQHVDHSNAHRRRAPEQQERSRTASRPQPDTSSRTRSTSTGSEPSTDRQTPEPEHCSGEDLRPRLRGGDGGRDEDFHTPSCGLTLKQLLLTCHRPNYRYSTNSIIIDETLQPARVPDASQIAQAIQKTQGTARLPRNLLRKSNPHAILRTTQVELCTGNIVTTYSECTPPIQTPRFHHFPISSPPHHYPAASPTNPHTLAILTLRGGASTPSTLSDDSPLPSTLFWLAGGRGPPITTRSWKRQRPKKRMGGLFGKLIYGTRAGTLYEGKKEGGGEGDAGSAKESVGEGSQKGDSSSAEEGKEAEADGSDAGSKKEEADAEAVPDKSEDAAKEGDGA